MFNFSHENRLFNMMIFYAPNGHYEYKDILPDSIRIYCPEEVVKAGNRCLADAKNKWNPVEDDSKTICCATWQAYDCIYVNINKCQNAEQIKEQFLKGERFDYEHFCYDFDRFSPGCTESEKQQDSLANKVKSDFAVLFILTIFSLKLFKSLLFL